MVMFVHDARHKTERYAMITVTFYDEHDKRGWEFRCLRSGVVESRNERKKLDWQERNADQMDMLADELYQIGQSLMVISSLHVKGQEMPKTDGVLVPRTQDFTVPV